VQLTDRRIEIQYSPESQTYFAEVSIEEKAYLDRRLTELAGLSRRPERQRDFERE